MEQGIVKAAQDKRFSDFESAVRTQLKTKLANHPEIVKYSNAMDKIQGMKDAFSKVSQIGSEEI